MPVYQIAVLQTNRDYFDYHSTDVLPLGTRVWVPFRQSIKLGIVVGSDDTNVISSKLKSIAQVLDTSPILSSDILKLCHWISQYYQSPLALVLALALPKHCREGKLIQTSAELYYELNMSTEETHQVISARAMKQHQCIALIAHKKSIRSQDLNRMGFSNTIIKSLLEKKVLKTNLLPIQPFVASASNHPPVVLNEEQQQAVDLIRSQIHTYHCFLLEGVTGSGKTEVYFHLIADV
ncbi:MAG TPA: primosomal protein N', partial [Legionellaceae bacterium]|nr:primosomal protein N' [Legionellaceae bacterium]